MGLYLAFNPFWNFFFGKVVHPTRLYRCHAAGPSIHLEPVAVSADELDPRHVFFLDAGRRLSSLSRWLSESRLFNDDFFWTATGKKLYVWFGLRSKNTLCSKTRLLAEKINKDERKAAAEIHVCQQVGIAPPYFSNLRPALIRAK